MESKHILSLAKYRRHKQIGALVVFKILSIVLIILVLLIVGWIGGQLSFKLKTVKLSESTESYEGAKPTSPRERFPLISTTQHSIFIDNKDEIVFDISALQFSDNLVSFEKFLSYDSERGLVYLDGYSGTNNKIDLFRVLRQPKEDLERAIEDHFLSLGAVDEAEISNNIRAELDHLDPDGDHSAANFRTFCHLESKKSVNGVIYFLVPEENLSLFDFGKMCGDGAFLATSDYLIFTYATGVDASEPQVRLDRSLWVIRH